MLSCMLTTIALFFKRSPVVAGMGGREILQPADGMLLPIAQTLSRRICVCLGGVANQPCCI